MTIQFQCKQCNKTLSVGDEHAGKSASCPDCQTVTPVPYAANPFSDFGQENLPSSAAPAGGGIPQNPYAAPNAASAPGKMEGDGSIRPRAVEFGEIFNAAWEHWKNNLGLLIGVTLVMIIANVAFSVVGGIVQAAINGGIQRNGAEGALAAQAIGMVGNAFALFLGIGQVRINLDIARGKSASFETLFSGGDRFLPILGTTILFVIAYCLGLVLLIVPGVLVALFFWGYYYLQIDRKCGAMESFSLAMSFCKMNAGTSFLLGVVGLGILLVGFLALCVGIIAAIPLVSMMWAVAYLKMSGQQ